MTDPNNHLSPPDSAPTRETENSKRLEDLRLNRSNPLYENLLDLRLEKEREVPRFATWTNASEITDWLVSPLVMAAIAVAILALGVGYYFLQVASSKAPNIIIGDNALQLPPQMSADEEIAAIHATISGFVEADGPDTQLEFVRHPEQSRRRMEEFYRRQPGVPGLQVVDYTMITKTDSQRYQFFVAQALYNNNTRQNFTVMQDGDRFLIDWESSVGYNPMEWETFLSLKPGAPLDWRVHVTQSDYYAGAFADHTQWRSVKLTYPHSEQISYAWYPADHVDTNALTKLLTVGPECALILKLAFTGDDDRQLEVLKLVNDTWIIP
ncbi:MAG: hypothetical protein KDN22_22260 [Verrucomicrobiae bacterium]|nr:hypothetical protein [Verrucomicrobiae bacterium]